MFGILWVKAKDEETLNFFFILLPGQKFAHFGGL